MTKVWTTVSSAMEIYQELSPGEPFVSLHPFYTCEESVENFRVLKDTRFYLNITLKT